MAGTGQIKTPKVSCREKRLSSLQHLETCPKSGTMFSAVDRSPTATCITVEHVGWSPSGGGEGGVLGQEAEGRGQGDLAVGAVVLPGDARDNGVFQGNGTFKLG